jgi:hypothetical protein
VKKAAEGAALGTGTKVDYELIGGDYSILPNDVLGRVVDANLRRVGAPQWTGEEMAFAERLRTTLIGDNLPPLSAAKEIQPYRVNGQKYSSTDSGDVSWVTPLATLNTATWVPGTAAHSWQATATGGMGIGIKGAVVAAKTLALTAAQLYQTQKQSRQRKRNLKIDAVPASFTSRLQEIASRRSTTERIQVSSIRNRQITGQLCSLLKFDLVLDSLFDSLVPAPSEACPSRELSEIEACRNHKIPVSGSRSDRAKIRIVDVQRNRVTKVGMVQNIDRIQTQFKLFSLGDR